MIRVKVCCISSKEEARIAVECGASALGLVGHMPTGPGVISDEQIRTIAATVPPPVATFLLTSETDAARIVAHQRAVQTSVIQIVDALKSGSYADIRSALPSVKLVQVIHVLGPESVDEALAAADEVDALLLDSGNPLRRELGGTGRTHDWTVSRTIIEQSRVPVFLAGGLTPVNVRTAIDAVGPFGIDICSGVRTDGNLDRAKLIQLMTAIHGR